MRLLFLILWLPLLLLAGCETKPAGLAGPGKGGGPPGGPGGMPGMGPGGMGSGSELVLEKLPGGPEFAAGKKVYADHNCARCHKLGDTGGGNPFGGMGGPPGGWKGGPGGEKKGPPEGFAGEKKGPPEGFADGKKGPPGEMKGPRPGGGMGGGMNGPDLTKTGADPIHTVAWLSAHIRDPRSHSPGSKMPASGPDRIPDADLQALAEYLAGRK